MDRKSAHSMSFRSQPPAGSKPVDPRDPDCQWWDTPDGRMVWIDPDPMQARAWARLLEASQRRGGEASQPVEVGRMAWE